MAETGICDLDEPNTTATSSQNTNDIENSFEIAIHNMPKRKGFKEVRKFMILLGLKPKRVNVSFDHAYVSFDTEADASSAISTLGGYRWKGKVLRVKRANPRLPKESKKLSMDLNEKSKDLEFDERFIDWSAAVVKSTTPLAHQPYTEQLQVKQAESYKLVKKVSWEISNVAGTKPPPGQPYYGILENIRPSPVQEGYRNKCEFTVGFGPDGKSPEIGFMVNRCRPGACTVVSAEFCVHVPQIVKTALIRIRDFLRSTDCPLPPYSINSGEGFWRLITAKFFKFDFMLIFTVNDRNVAESTLNLCRQKIIDLFFDANDSKPLAIYRVTSLYFNISEFSSSEPKLEKLAGSPFVYETVLNCRFRISPATFFQTNTAGCHVLYNAILDHLKLLNEKLENDHESTSTDNKTSKNGILLLDVCCGAGTIGISMANCVKKVIGIELVEQAVEDAKVNAKCNEKLNCEFLAGKAEELFFDLKRHHLLDLDSYAKVVAVLDPPRKGLGDKIISCLRECRQITSVIYVSCDPKGASKNFVDLCRRPSKRYGGLPFELKRVIPVDLFPHTDHFEWVMFFERQELIIKV